MEKIAMEEERPRGKFARVASLWDLDKTAKIGDNHALLAKRLAGRPGEDRDAALLDAARRGASGVAKKLGQNGANPNARGPRGRTALHLAALSGNLDTVRAVLEEGADKSILDDAKADAAALARAIGKHHIAHVIDAWSSPYDDQVFGFGDAQAFVEPSAALATRDNVQLLESGIAQKRAVFGSRHPGLAPTLSKLSQAYELAGRLKESAQAQLEACELAPTPERYFRLARARMAIREPKKAIIACEQGLLLVTENCDAVAESAMRRRLLLARGAAQGAVGDFCAQADTYRQVVSLAESKTSNNEDFSFVRPLVGLGEALGRQRAHRESVQIFTRALQIADRHLPSAHPDIGVIMEHLANALTDAHEFHKAQALYRRVMEIQRANRLDTGATHDRMATSIVRQHKFAKDQHRKRRVEASSRRRSLVKG